MIYSHKEKARSASGMYAGFRAGLGRLWPRPRGDMSMDRIEARDTEEHERTQAGAIPHWTSGASLHVIASSGSPLLACSTGLATQFRRVSRYPDLSDCTAFLGGRSKAYRVLVLDLDCIGLRAEVIDGLAALRRAAPDLIVIIGSTDFSRHDFSTDRSMIADASVRLPASKTILGLALGAGAANRAMTAAAH